MAHERTVLVVDDNAANRDLLSRRLARKGFAVRVAEDGEKALGLLSRERIDLVLLDIMMPGLSGLEVLTRIRKTRSPAELPVIMVTAKTESEDVVDALDRGADAGHVDAHRIVDDGDQRPVRPRPICHGFTLPDGDRVRT